MTTPNPNVPRGVTVIAHTSYCSGEICYDYYADNEGRVYKVCDWVNSKPQPVSALELSTIAGERYIGIIQEATP